MHRNIEVYMSTLFMCIIFHMQLDQELGLKVYFQPRKKRPAASSDKRAYEPDQDCDFPGQLTSCWHVLKAFQKTKACNVIKFILTWKVFMYHVQNTQQNIKHCASCNSLHWLTADCTSVHCTLGLMIVLSSNPDRLCYNVVQIKTRKYMSALGQEIPTTDAVFIH